MVRFIIWEHVVDGLHYGEGYGESTDTKPTAGVITGSKFTEVNTGKVYLFSEATSTWNEWLSP